MPSTISGQRWVAGLVLGLVFAASSGDRAVIGVLKTTLAGELALSQTDYARLVAALLLPYAAAMVVSGAVINRLGPRRVLAGCLLLASGAVAWCGGAHGYTQVAAAQIVLGLAQAGVAPTVACVIVREFPVSAQASTYAIVNAIQSSATILCPPFVATTTLLLGWRYAFYLPAAAGVAFAVLWWCVSRRWVACELGRAAEKWALAEAWREIWRCPDARRLLLARVVSDPLWFFFQFWLPSYLREHIGLSLAEVGQVAWLPPLASVGGVLAFGVLSDRFAIGGDPTARVKPLLWVAALAPAAFVLPLVHSTGAAMALAMLVQTMCAVWLSLSAILMGSLVSARSLAPALGIMSACGCIAGLTFSLVAGGLVANGGYRWPFWIGALLYPCAALLARGIGRSSPSHEQK